MTQEFYIDAGYLNVDSSTGLVRPTIKWWYYREGVSDTLSQKIITFAETGFLNRCWSFGLIFAIGQPRLSDIVISSY